ncbi:MarR family transcriptional regulator [Ectopseudomonas hydrolytica]|jgi:DNA-binding MarR family transcriptional regulator|uniref:MarR family transcriptional regulator n=1 Tax=Ectopseudomonas hydrolytica TaxID=2493633 RepID=A0ABY5A3K3_9GAMM|nr:MULTISPECIES: MarR family transcriptional regulator [Pseudomonas]ARS49797.1 MarR family transcriptional regulator [Pseudomonas mendocina]ATH81463.1 MarR family transcriptional regulator [Pseudomonas mendocina]MDH0098952.1 MarR family transcriptional regulator [Pseudomonas sp. GD04158]USR38340.1 MarR family transcriptional regulator [Pseudomonas hydrolytica]UTH35021.1 MarR family transcriptional regulator [Pseudomonas sp. KHPS1]
MQDRAQLAANQWQQQRPDLDGFSMAVIGRLGELSQVISRDHLLPFFAAHGLQAGEFDLLATLRRSGEPYALMPTTLYESAMISSGGMTSRIDRLEKAGLIERRKHPSDRRGVLVALTPAGFDLIDGMLAAHVANLQRVLSGLTVDEQQTLHELTGKLLAGLVQRDE